MNARARPTSASTARYEMRVLEPSPPAVGDGPWFADDPVARGEVPAGHSVVSPVGTGDAALGRPRLGRPRPRRMVRRSLARRLPPAWAGAGEARADPDRAAPRRRAGRLAGAAQGQRQDRTALHARRVRHAVLRRRRPGSRPRRGARRPGREPASESRRSRRSPPRPTTSAAICSPMTSSSIASHSTSTRRPRPSSATGTGSPPLCSKSYAPSAGDDARPVTRPALARALRPRRRARQRSQRCPRRVRTVPGGRRSPRAVSLRRALVAPAPDELWQATGFSGAELLYAELLGAADQRQTALDFFRARLRALVE